MVAAAVLLLSMAWTPQAQQAERVVAVGDAGASSFPADPDLGGSMDDSSTRANATVELLAFANTTISSTVGLGTQANRSRPVVLRGAGSSALQPLVVSAQQLAGGQGRAQRQGFDVSYDALGTGAGVGCSDLRVSLEYMHAACGIVPDPGVSAARPASRAARHHQPPSPSFLAELPAPA